MIGSPLLLALSFAIAPLQEPQAPPSRQLVVQLSVNPVDLAERSRTFRCAVRLDRGGEKLELGEVEVEPLGAHLFRWEIPEDWFTDHRTSCHARLVTPGLQQQEGGARIVRKHDLHDRNGTEAQPLELRLLVKRGSTWSGRILPASKALVGGRVRLVRPGDAKPEIIATEPLYSSGEYTLHLAATGTFDLSARAPGVGTARHEGISIEGGVSGRLPDLLLVGPGTIRGRVIEEHGGSVKGRRVIAQHEAIPEIRQWFHPGTTRAGDGEGDRGCRSGSSTLDEEGHFAITGLEAGSYRVFVVPVDWSSAWIEAEGSPFSTRPEARTISISTPMLEVRIVDPEGEPVSPTQMGQSTFGARGDSWVALLAATPEGEAIGYTAWSGPPPIPTEGAGYAWQVQPGKHYVVQVSSARYGLTEEHLVTPADGAPLRRSMVVPAAAEPAEIRLEVAFPEGVTGSRDWSVTVGSAETGASLEHHGKYSEREKLTLGAGRYRLQFDSDPFPQFCAHAVALDPPRDPAPCAPVERVLEVVAGESRTLRIEFTEGGRLRLQATIDGEPSPEVAALLDWFSEPVFQSSDGSNVYATSQELRWLLDTGRHPGGGRVELLDDPAAPTRLDFFWPDAEVVSRWGHFLPGRSNLLRDPLPPGRHRLRFSLPGCTPIEREMVIGAGEVAELSVQFTRK